MRLSLVTSATVAVLVGFGGTIAVIVAAARAVGADADQTTSWVIGLCLAMAATSSFLSWRFRMPIVTAWSTPGAALIAASAGTVTLEAAVGAFLLAALLIQLTAAWRPLGRLVQRIPTSLAAAMLAGVLLQFVVAGFQSASTAPALVLPLVLLFLLVRPIHPSMAVLLVLAGGGLLAWLLGMVGPLPPLHPAWPSWIMPALEPAVLIGLGLPLYLVTMASQNLPGLAVLQAAGYQPPVAPILATTGLASLLTAPMGAHTSNLAAITASLCTGPDTHPDPARRWPAGVIYGLLYLLLAIFAGSVVGLLAATPPQLVAAVAGLALLGPLTGALATALAAPAERAAAVLTLAVAASGLSLLGIGAAFWGLAAGLLALALEAATRRWRG